MFEYITKGPEFGPFVYDFFKLLFFQDIKDAGFKDHASFRQLEFNYLFLYMTNSGFSPFSSYVHTRRKSMFATIP